MAEGGFDPTSRKPKGKVQQICRYYVHGACERGENCKFLHDRTGTAPANNVCKFYQNGLCSYGSRCRYDHVKPSQTTKHSEVTPKKNSRQHSEPPKHHQRGHQNGDNWGSSMVTLKKGGGGTTVASKEPFNHGQEKYRKNWHKAQDFVPGQKTHAGASYAKAALPPNVDEKDNMAGPNEYLPSHQATDEDLLCPYFAHGHCPYEGDCVYIHGDICDICLFPRLHPTDTAQREQHNKECLKEMEKDMEHSFAIQESQDKECCICLELVLEKAEKEAAGASKARSSSDQLFGILENCIHCFCLSCIRRWRSDKTFGKNVRVCPICRVHSDFVTPSNVWVEDEEKKKKVIQDYKDRLSIKTCQYFKQGKGRCPFNEKCFYKHAYPDGTIAKPEKRKPRRRVNADGDSDIMEAISLWEFLERREDGLISLEDELSLYLLGMLQDSDDDDDHSHLFWFDSSNSDSSSDF